MLSRPSFSGIAPIQLIIASASIRNAMVIWEEKSSVSSKIDLVIHQNVVPITFLILNFRRVLIVVSFLLGKSPASLYYYMPTFRNSLSVPSSKAMVKHCVLPLP